MLDLTTESPLPLAAAAKLVPPGRGGKRTHLSTLLRWVLTGALAPGGTRVRLEAVRLGGRWVTSLQALQRFAERLTPRLEVEANAHQVRSTERRRKASEQAEAELKRLGV